MNEVSIQHQDHVVEEHRFERLDCSADLRVLALVCASGGYNQIFVNANLLLDSRLAAVNVFLPVLISA
jgi:hypothetical protein